MIRFARYSLLVLCLSILLLTTGVAQSAAALPLLPMPATRGPGPLPPLPANPQAVADFGRGGALLVTAIGGRAGLQLPGDSGAGHWLTERPLPVRAGDNVPLLALAVGVAEDLPAARLVVDLRGMADAAPHSSRFYLARRDPANPRRWIEVPLTVHDPGGLVSAPLSGAGDWEAGIVPEAWRPTYEPPAADAYSGAAAYTYGLPLPPARGTWTPALALRYNSRGVDGRIVASTEPAQLADGWALTETRIVRENVHLDEDMSHRPVLVYPELYRLLLDGAGYRLTAIAQQGAQTSFSAAGLPGVRVVRHTLPTVDGRQRAFWTVEQADGVRLRLGYDDGAVAYQATPHEAHIALDSADAGIRQAEFAWALDLVVDPYGNGAHVDYLTHQADESLFYPHDGNWQEVIFSTSTIRLLHLRYNFPARVGSGWPHVAPPAGTPATTVAFRAAASDDLVAGTFAAPLDHIYVFQGANPRPQMELRLTTTVRGYESAGCDAYFTRSRLVIALQQFAGTDGDPATADLGTAALPAVTFAYATLPHFNAGGSDCFFFDHLARVDNGYGATTDFSYVADGRTVGEYIHTPWARILPRRGLSYLVSAVANSPDGGAPVRHSYAYEGLCYAQAEPEVDAALPGARGCGSPWSVDDGPLLGADQVTTTTTSGAGTVLRTLVQTFAQAQFEQEEQIRGRPLQSRIYDEAGQLLLSEETAFAVVGNEPYTPFYFPAATTTTTHDPATGAGLRSGTRRLYTPALQGGAQHGNLTVLIEEGDLDRAGDERTIITCFAPAVAAGRWQVDRPWLSRVFAGALAESRLQPDLCAIDYRSDDLLLESRTAYDGAPLGTPPRRGSATATWLGVPDAPLDGGTAGLLAGPVRTIDAWGNLVAVAESSGRLTTLTYDARYHLRPLRMTESGSGVTAQTTHYQFYGLEGAPTAANGNPMPLGALQEQRTAAGLVTRYEYDPFGRLFATYDSAADQGSPTDPWDGNPRVRQRYWDNRWNDATIMAAPLAVAEELRPAVYSDGAGSSLRRTLTYLDGYGQARQVRQRGAEVAGSAADVITLLAYDAWGNVRCRAVPYSVAPATGYVTTACDDVAHLAGRFDPLGRPLLERRPSGAATRYAYQLVTGALQRIRVDANGHQTRTTWDALGRLTAEATTLAICDAACLPGERAWVAYGETRYEYDLLHRPILVVDPNGQKTTLHYDPLGRKIGLDDPNAGPWRYGYDGSGNLVWQEDPRGERLCFRYDVFQRPVEKWSTPSDFCDSRQRTMLAHYTYDVQADGAAAPGMLTGIRWAPDGAANGEQLTYDAQQRLRTMTRTIDGVAYTQRITAYNWFDQPLEEILANGSVVRRSYDAAGPLSLQVDGQRVVERVQRDALGRVTRLALGNGVVTRYAYGADSTDFRLSGMSVEREGRLLLGMAYGYDPVGNLVLQDELTGGELQSGLLPPKPERAERQRFVYDALDRLVAAAGDHPGIAYAHQYHYDQAGNLQAVIDRQSGEATAYTYDPQRRRLATAAGAETYAYDAAGMMVTRSSAERTFAQHYDAAGRLTTVVEETQTGRAFTWLAYDDGQRPVRISSPDGQVRHQPFADVQIDDSGLPGERWQVTHRLGSLPVAVDVSGGSAPGRYYVHGDQVGSRIFLTYGRDHDRPGQTLSGQIVSGSQARYLPYGGSRLAALLPPADARYAGHPLLDGTGLVQMGARFYLPALRRFLTPDALAPADGPASATQTNALTLSYAEEALRMSQNGGVRGLLANPLPAAQPDTAVAAAVGLGGGLQLDRYGYANYRPVQETDPSGHTSFWVDIDLETAQALVDALLGDSSGNPGLLSRLGLFEGSLDGIIAVTMALTSLVATPLAGAIAGLVMYVLSQQVGATLENLESFAHALRNAINGGGGDRIRLTVDHGLFGDEIVVSRAGGGTYTVLGGLFDRTGDLLIAWMTLADHGADVMWEIGGIVYYWRRAGA